MNNQKNVNKKPLKFNFNVIDMLIVLIIVAALFFVIYCVVLGNNISDLGAKDADVEYSVIISKADIRFKDSVAPGDKVTDAQTGKFLGTVRKTDYSFSVETIIDAEGNEKLYTSTDKIDITVTISCTAKIKGTEYYAGGILLETGNYIDIHFTNYAPTDRSYISGIAVTD